MLENKLNITNQQELAREERKNHEVKRYTNF